MLDRVLTEIGGWPQWALVFLLLTVLWQGYKSGRLAVANSDSLSKLSHEMNSMRSALELAAKAEGNLAGRREARTEMAAAGVTAKELARADLIADAETQAKVDAANPMAHAQEPTLVAVVTVAVDAPKVPNGGT